MSSKKNLAELRAENRILRQDRNASIIATVFISFFKYGAMVWVSYHIYLAVLALAGRTTFADIGISIFGSANISTSIAWIFGISGILYGLRQRKLRKDTVERLQGRNQELELKLDSKRSSSQLTPRGDTREEDK